MRKLLVLCCSLLTLVALASPAFAGPADNLSDAIITTASDNLEAVGTWVGSDITCKVDAYGGPITQETPIVVGKIFGQDFGIGRGECVSFTDNNYDIHTHAVIQYLDPNPTPKWKNTACFNDKDNSAVHGIAINPATVSTCTYDGVPDPYLDYYHRTHVCITNSLDAVARCFNSAPWYMRRA